MYKVRTGAALGLAMVWVGQDAYHKDPGDTTRESLPTTALVAVGTSASTDTGMSISYVADTMLDLVRDYPLVIRRKPQDQK